MIKKIMTVLCLLTIAVLLPATMYAYDFAFGESAFLELKGDLNYFVKMRAEDPDPLLVDDSKGNSNFENGDIVNNKKIFKLETMFDAPYVTFFGKFEVFHDSVYTDDDMYPEGTNVDLARQYAAYGAEAKEYYLDFHSESVTLRVGKQIVEWGELAAPVFAPGVNVMNLYDGSRIGAAGYTPRDYKAPAEMAWLSVEATSNLSVEAIYSQYFEPRATMPIVGTFGSSMDMMGFGGPDDLLDDQRPTSAEDMQQYGVAIRTVIPALSNLELGLFHANYLDFMPVTTGTAVTYERLDMYGITLSQVILDWQVYCEFSYRPNQAKQLGIEIGDDLLPIGGFEEVRTFNWGFGGLAMISDFLSFTPWTVQFSPMIEFYGGNNLDYDEDKNFTVPAQVSYYMMSFTFTSSDMIDNTTMTYGLSISGPMHEKESGFYSIANTLTARVGDNIGIMIGHDLKEGDPEKAGPYGYPHHVPDRDAWTVGLTVYFM